MLRTTGNRTSLLISHLEGSSTYLLSLRAYNSAGLGPPSAVVNVTTKKPRESRARGRGGGVIGPGETRGGALFGLYFVVDVFVLFLCFLVLFWGAGGLIEESLCFLIFGGRFFVSHSVGFLPLQSPV